MANRMGYELPIYYGVKGSTAATIIDNAVDVNYDSSVETGSTTRRGDGTAVPKETGEATMIKGVLTFNMIVDDADAVLVALLAAARSGVAVALKYDSFDCDCIISCKQGSPLNGEETIDFTVEKVSRSDREPTF